MLHYETIDAGTLELLKNLLSLNLFQQLRLVGGTSLALQIGHRKSIDLDLFGEIDVDVLEINNALAQIAQPTQLNNSKNIHIYLINGIKVDIVNYTYPWLEDVIYKDCLRLASNFDVAAMKLSAITGRGSKKDFIDLYFLLKQQSLSQMLDLYLRKFNDGSLFLVLKSLVYFDDADVEEMPNMLIPIKWKMVKATIVAAHGDYIRGLKS